MLHVYHGLLPVLVIIVPEVHAVPESLKMILPSAEYKTDPAMKVASRHVQRATM